MKIWYRLVTTFTIALILDGLTKFWAEHMLDPYHPVPVLDEIFRLTLGYNTGVAFGLFANGGTLPLIVTGLVIAGLAFWLTKALRAGEIPAKAGWPIGFLLGGAVANFVDRIPDGRVTDFLDIGFGTTRWPTFNLADSFITLALIYLMIITFEDRQVIDPHQPNTSSPENESY